MFKRALALAAALLLCFTAMAYPDKAINAIVPWGAGGGTDSLMRPLMSELSTLISKRVNVRNMAGGTGTIGTQFVYDSPADGYTLLLGAENPALYHALDLSELSYDDFECVLLLGDEQTGIVVSATSPYQSFTDLINAALANPGKIKLSTTGKGGLPWQGAALIKGVTGAEFNQIPYDSDATALTAVLNGEVDFTLCKIQSGIEQARAGNIKFIAMLSDTETEALEDVPPITQEYPGFTEYLPWGPFYGVYVKAGTDKEITEYLKESLLEAFNSQDYQTLLQNMYVRPLGLSGEEAQNYISKWSESACAALKSAGAI